MHNLSAFKVLAVDDDSINLRVIAQQLAALQPQILIATDGETALNVIEKESPDLVLLDINMPGMSGLEVCRAIEQKSE
jgi:CheY-like chemotaxis protein